MDMVFRFPNIFSRCRPSKLRQFVDTLCIIRLPPQCDIFALQECYEAYIGNYLPTFRDNLIPFSRVKASKKNAWTLKMGSIGCLETSVNDYKSRLRNTSEERRSLVYNLISKTFQPIFCQCGGRKSAHLRGNHLYKIREIFNEYT
jgi:hypothetical protein